MRMPWQIKKKWKFQREESEIKSAISFVFAKK